MGIADDKARANKIQNEILKSSAFLTLHKLLTEVSNHDVLWYHQVGECVETLFPMQEGRRYQDEYIENLVKVLDIEGYEPGSLKSLLWNTRNFFDKYRKSEVKRLIAKAAKVGHQLSWSHFLYLAGLDDKQRLAMQQACLRGRWSCDRLLRESKAKYGKKSKGGKPMRRPRTLTEGLEQCIEHSGRWLHRYKKAWFTSEGSFLDKEATKTEMKQLPELFDQTRELLAEMGKYIRDAEMRLKQKQAKTLAKKDKSK